MDFPGGRRLDLANAGSIDVRPVEARSRRETGALARSCFQSARRRQRARQAKREAADNAAAPLPAPRESAGAAASRPEAGDVPSSTEPLEAG